MHDARRADVGVVASLIRHAMRARGTLLLASAFRGNFKDLRIRLPAPGVAVALLGLHLHLPHELAQQLQLARGASRVRGECGGRRLCVPE